MQIQKVFEQLGFHPNDTKVYIASLSLGDALISEISEKARIPRTSTKESVARLHKENLMFFYEKRERKFWSAEKPEKLIKIFQKKEQLLESILPQLESLRHDSSYRPSIKLYSGINGIQAIFDDIIETKHNLLSYTSAENAIKLVGEEFSYFIERRHKHNLKVNFLTNRTPFTEKLRELDKDELRTTRFFPNDIIITTANFIYGDKVAIISFNKKFPSGFIVNDPDIAETQRSIFDFMWQHSE